MATVTPSALARVPQHSPASANARITERAIKSVKEAAKMSEEELTTRIGGLQREWWAPPSSAASRGAAFPALWAATHLPWPPSLPLQGY